MKRLARVGLASCLFVLGCMRYETVPAPPVAPTPELARICVIRASPELLPAPVTVHDNGLLVGATEPSSFFCYLAQPGAHVVTTTMGDAIDRRIRTGDIARATLAAEAGGRYYLAQEVVEGAIPRVVWIDENAAGQLARGCAPLWLSDVPSGEWLPRPNVAAPALALRP